MDAAKRKADVALFVDSVELRADIDLKVEAHHLKSKFCNNAETMLHGDFHTGSAW